VSGGVLDGLRPAQTPAASAAASVGWSRGDWGAALQLRGVGAQYEDDLNRLRLPAAVTVDGSVRVPLASRLQLLARAENLLDARMLAGITADGTDERATPRTLWLGLRLTDRR
jgi:outer membrane receptor protein involved in Fe transport